MLVLTYRYRLYPDLQQELQIAQWLETCRGVYNYAVRERKDWIKSRRCAVNACSRPSEYIIPADAPYPGYYLQKKALTQAKKTFPHLQAVHSQVLQDVIGRVDAAFKNFNKRGFGFPRFKKFGQYKSFLFPQVKAGDIQGGRIRLPKIGWVDLRLHRPIPEGFVPKTFRIIRKASGWYVAIALELNVDVPDPQPRGEAVGIDVGLEYFLSTSDGAQVKRPRFFNKLQRKLELLQRRLRKKQKGSQNRRKLNQKIARIHERIANCRLNFHFEAAHKLCDRAEMVFVEDLDFRIMAKGMLGKHTLDAGLGQFVNVVLPWVCWKRDVYYNKVDPNGTSQECPDCGAVVRKDLKVREHHCPECGSVKPRDIASGQVIRNRGVSAVGHIVEKLPVDGSCRGREPRQDRVKQELSRAILGSPRLIA
ncbi:MAG: transposase [Cyanobacteria bacterium J06641_5]